MRGNRQCEDFGVEEGGEQGEAGEERSGEMHFAAEEGELLEGSWDVKLKVYGGVGLDDRCYSRTKVEEKETKRRGRVYPREP